MYESSYGPPITTIGQWEQAEEENKRKLAKWLKERAEAKRAEAELLKAKEANTVALHRAPGTSETFPGSSQVATEINALLAPENVSHGMPIRPATLSPESDEFARLHGYNVGDSGGGRSAMYRKDAEGPAVVSSTLGEGQDASTLRDAVKDRWYTGELKEKFKAHKAKREAAKAKADEKYKVFRERRDAQLSGMSLPQWQQTNVTTGMMESQSAAHQQAVKNFQEGKTDPLTMIILSGGDARAAMAHPDVIRGNAQMQVIKEKQAAGLPLSPEEETFLRGGGAEQPNAIQTAARARLDAESKTNPEAVADRKMRLATSPAYQAAIQAIPQDKRQELQELAEAGAAKEFARMAAPHLKPDALQAALVEISGDPTAVPEHPAGKYFFQMGPQDILNPDVGWFKRANAAAAYPAVQGWKQLLGLQ